MTDQPQDGYLIVRKIGYQLPFSAEIYPVTLDPTPPPPDPALEARRAAAARDIPAAIRRLDALEDRVSRAVLDLHSRVSRYDRWRCAICGVDMDYYDWPCDTVEAVATVHGIDLTDAWLFNRPADGSLDQPQPDTTTETT